MIEREDLGSVLHTSLRKFCDSAATTIAYNAIQHLDNKIWKAYLDILWEELNKIEAPTIEDVKEISDAFDDYLVWNGHEKIYAVFSKKPLQQSLYYILISSFKLFTEEDWSNYAYYVFNE